MKITFNSPLILTFSFICVIVLILTYYLGMFENSFMTSARWGSGGILSYFTLFSHVVGHANLEHLIGNLSFILLIGPIVEKHYGSKLLLIMILTTALATSVFNILFFDSGLLGASGIVFMLIILTSMINIKHKEIPLSFILVVIIFIGKEVINALSPDQVAQFAHIIGGVVGGVFGFLLAGKPDEKATLKTEKKDPLTGLY